MVHIEGNPSVAQSQLVDVLKHTASADLKRLLKDGNVTIEFRKLPLANGVLGETGTPDTTNPSALKVSVSPGKIGEQAATLLHEMNVHVVPRLKECERLGIPLNKEVSHSAGEDQIEVQESPDKVSFGKLDVLAFEEQINQIASASIDLAKQPFYSEAKEHVDWIAVDGEVRQSYDKQRAGLSDALQSGTWPKNAGSDFEDSCHKDIEAHEAGMKEEWKTMQEDIEKHQQSTKVTVALPTPSKAFAHLAVAKANSNASQVAEIEENVIADDTTQNEVEPVDDIDLSDQDLSGRDFSSEDLSNHDLSGKNLTNCNLTNCKLTNTNFTNAQMQGASLSFADAQGAIFNGADMQEAEFVQTKLQGASLQYCSMEKAFLGGANLSGANMGQAILKEANLSEAILQNADLTGAQLGSANLKGAQLQGATLTKADLSRANLENANLSQAVLPGADLSHVPLYNADFTGADLSGVAMNYAKVGTADFTGATMDGVTGKAFGMAGNKTLSEQAVADLGKSQGIRYGTSKKV